jgi:hypothetical protein
MTSELIQILIANAGVQTAVGTSQITGKYKVFPFVAPQKEQGPFIVVIKKSSETTGSANCIGTLDFGVYEVRSWSKNYITTEEIHEAARVALETGTGIFMVNDFDGFDQESDMYCHIGVYRTNETRS